MDTAVKGRGRGDRSAVHQELRVMIDRPAQLASFRRRVRMLLSKRGLRADEREAIVLATNEALSNALQACEVADCRIEVIVSLIADYVCVEVRDADERFEGVCLDLVDVAGETAEHGRGLYLMRELMESLELVPRSRGMLVRMVKRLKAGEPRDEPDEFERIASLRSPAASGTLDSAEHCPAATYPGSRTRNDTSG